MTLILNELRIEKGLENSYWICSADRRLSFEGKFHSNRKKIYPIKNLNATISYFGLAIWRIGDKEIYMSDIIKNFILKNFDCATLDDFTSKFQTHLNNKVPKNLLKVYPSGFHFSGFNDKGWPHFLHFSNIGNMDGYGYKNLTNQYKNPSADFLERDATQSLHWDGKSPDKIDNTGFIYRNGDIRTHVLISSEFDSMMKKIFELPDFDKINNDKKHADFVNFKFDFIAKLYEKWTNNKVIGKPIDLYILKPNEILFLKNNKWEKLKN